jgi:hypothetical protein
MSLAADIMPPVLIGGYMVLGIAFRWKAKVAFVAAFAALLLSCFTFPIHELSDHLAFSSFYFLLAGAILLLAEHIRERRQED